MSTMIDTLEFAERFEDAGFEHAKARALATAFATAQGAGREDLVTKQALAETEARLLKAITELGQSLRKDQAEMDVRLTRQIGETGNNVMGKLWLAVVVVGGLAAAISTAATLLLK